MLPGRLRGTRNCRPKAKMDKAKGSAHNLAGDVKDAVRKAGE
jgi:uncharacterized protein YjbJ (UPF0337 family)